MTKFTKFITEQPTTVAALTTKVSTLSPVPSVTVKFTSEMPIPISNTAKQLSTEVASVNWPWGDTLIAITSILLVLAGVFTRRRYHTRQRHRTQYQG